MFKQTIPGQYKIIGNFTDSELASIRIILLNKHDIDTLVVDTVKTNCKFIDFENLKEKFKYIYLPKQQRPKNKKFCLQVKASGDYQMIFTDYIESHYKLPKSLYLFTLSTGEYINIRGEIKTRPGYVIRKMGWSKNGNDVIVNISTLPIYDIKTLFTMVFNILGENIRKLGRVLENPDTTTDLGHGQYEYVYNDGLDEATFVFITDYILNACPNDIFAHGKVYKCDIPYRISTTIKIDKIIKILPKALAGLAILRAKFLGK